MCIYYKCRLTSLGPGGTWSCIYVKGSTLATLVSVIWSCRIYINVTLTLVINVWNYIYDNNFTIILSTVACRTANIGCYKLNNPQDMNKKNCLKWAALWMQWLYISIGLQMSTLHKTSSCIRFCAMMTTTTYWKSVLSVSQRNTKWIILINGITTC